MIPAYGSFSGHESFRFRHTWLTKGVTQCSKNSAIFNSDDAMAVLGVGKNMVRSIRHWCLATSVLEEDSTVKNNRGRLLRPTEIGRRLFLELDAWDPYLEDVGTLWLIHWLLLTNQQRATTWHFTFNEIHYPEFSKRALEYAIWEYAQKIPNVRITEGTLKRDIDVFVRTYVRARHSTAQPLEESLDCPFVELNLIREQPQAEFYAFNRGPKDTLPDAVFLFAVGNYARRHRTQRSLTFEELAYGRGSPGRVFKLDESSLGERLEKLDRLTKGAWHFSETAGLKQVVFSKDIDLLNILASYYKGPNN